MHLKLFKKSVKLSQGQIQEFKKGGGHNFQLAQTLFSICSKFLKKTDKVGGVGGTLTPFFGSAIYVKTYNQEVGVGR